MKTKQNFQLIEFKTLFLRMIEKMSLEDIDDDFAEEILTLRYCNEFEYQWTELSDNCPDISEIFSKQIVADSEKIYKSLPKKIHHEISSCICEDFELLAGYLIANEDNRYIAEMLLSYADGNIPSLYLEKSEKSIQEAFNELQDKYR